jgi:hypothetical protein
MQDQLDEVVLDCGDNFARLKGEKIPKKSEYDFANDFESKLQMQWALVLRVFKLDDK